MSNHLEWGYAREARAAVQPAEAPDRRDYRQTTKAKPPHPPV